MRGYACHKLLLICLAASATGALADTAPPDRRAVSVSGRGEVEAAPDRARLSMGVDVTRSDVRSAQTEVNRIVREYLAQARALGAHDEDLSTAGLSIRSEYDYSAKNGRKFLGYHVSREILVTVRDLDKIGDFLLRATDAGINNVSDPLLESSKAEELRRQALAKAALDARAKAQLLAETLGMKLGSVHTLNANIEEAPPRPIMMKAAFAAAPEAGGNNESGFVSGQIRFAASVSADFDLLAQ